MITIEEAHIDQQLADAAALFREYASTLGFDLAFQDFEHELASLPGDYAPPYGCILLATREGDPAGCVALRPMQEPGVCEMKRLYIRPAHRGTRLGRSLATAIIEAARAAGYERMRLDTVPEMTPAITLYESLGFLDIPPYRHNPIEGARYMELRLQEAGRSPRVR